MNIKHLNTRRDFLKFGCRTIATMGAAAAFGEPGRLAAQTAGASDYKALVCIFLFGGSDANNVLVPNESTGPRATDLRTTQHTQTALQTRNVLETPQLPRLRAARVCLRYAVTHGKLNARQLMGRRCDLDLMIPGHACRNSCDEPRRAACGRHCDSIVNRASR